jgi:hypothetical protein
MVAAALHELFSPKISYTVLLLLTVCLRLKHGPDIKRLCKFTLNFQSDIFICVFTIKNKKLHRLLLSTVTVKLKNDLA